MGENWKEEFGDEWEYIRRLGAALHDPEEKRSFWETVKAKKRQDPLWSIYDDFPKGPLKEHFPGHHVCAEIIEMLAVHKPKDNNPEQR